MNLVLMPAEFSTLKDELFYAIHSHTVNGQYEASWKARALFEVCLEQEKYHAEATT